MILIAPGHAIHEPLVADTREARSALTVHAEAVEAGLGQEYAFVGQDGRALSWRASLSAAVFMGFDTGGDLTFRLLTFDGLFGLPVDLRWGAWGARVEWAHESAHFADGIRFADDRPDEGEREPWSREWLQTELSRGADGVRGYVGLRQVFHSVGGALPFRGQVGFCADGPGRVGPYAALDLSASTEHDLTPTASFQAGARFSTENGPALRIGGAAYEGMNDFGRWSGERERYVGLTLGVDAGREGG